MCAIGSGKLLECSVARMSSPIDDELHRTMHGLAFAPLTVDSMGSHYTVTTDLRISPLNLCRYICRSLPARGYLGMTFHTLDPLVRCEYRHRSWVVRGYITRMLATRVWVSIEMYEVESEVAEGTSPSVGCILIRQVLLKFKYWCSMVI